MGFGEVLDIQDEEGDWVEDDCFLDFIKRGMEMRRTSFVSDSIIEFICMC